MLLLTEDCSVLFLQDFKLVISLGSRERDVDTCDDVMTYVNSNIQQYKDPVDLKSGTTLIITTPRR